MPKVGEVWEEALPEIRKQVTGVGVWAAVNAAKPIALEDGFLVLGLDHSDMELAGHLRMAFNTRVIEQVAASKAIMPLKLRVIEGTTQADWDAVKRRDLEARRLQELALNRAKAEHASRSSWDGVYDALSRSYAGIPNKSMPQNRARFYREAVLMLAEARRNQTSHDDMGERNFARCIERIAQYSEVPSTIVAQDVMIQLDEI